MVGVLVGNGGWRQNAIYHFITLLWICPGKAKKTPGKRGFRGDNRLPEGEANSRARMPSQQSQGRQAFAAEAMPRGLCQI
jgi:hypothetical protein